MYISIGKTILLTIVIGVLSGCLSEYENSDILKPEEGRSVKIMGYLDRSALPDSLALVPPVPKNGSPTMARDKAVSKKSLALRGSKRWELAIKDSILDFPEAANTFSCVLGVPISQKETPQIYRLLRGIYIDAKASTHRAKITYHRTRPFVLNREPICTPDKETILRKNGSYPSGHSAIGWATALTLTEIDPDNTTKILARGKAYSESRVICNVHWYSDIMWGRFMGASTVARLHADPEYRKAIKAAKSELKSVRKKGLNPTNDCRFEAEALSIKLYQ
ncbi:MAG: phosphatase PAP2 family protein [Campylobacterota bacterium]|nr:phosphatase PAP2 family protein [Campylobacterota bacterium]